MRDNHDKRTLTIEGLPGMRGRPAKDDAKTPAQRQRDCRNKKEIAKVRRNNDLVAMFEGKSTFEIAETLKNQIWLTIPGDQMAQEAKAPAKDAWDEIGRRMGWL